MRNKNNNKKKIFAILGKSNSGKSTIYKKLMKLIKEDGRLINELKCCTTRPMREEDFKNSEYCFLDKEDFVRLHRENGLLEYAVYETVYGHWMYFTRKEDLKDGHYIKIINPSGLAQLKDSVKTMGYEVISFLIEADYSTRMERANNRNDGLSKEETERRFKNDDKDFKSLKVDYVISNNGDEPIDEIVDFIYDKIKKNIKI